MEVARFFMGIKTGAAMLSYLVQVRKTSCVMGGTLLG